MPRINQSSTKEPRLYETVQNRLVSGEFKLGQYIDLEAICFDHDASASEMREVLFRLSLVGLSVVDQDKFYVPQESPELLQDLIKTLSLLENNEIYLSARNTGPEWETDEAKPDFDRNLIGECQSETLKELHLRVYLRYKQQLVVSERKHMLANENADEF